MIILMTPIKPQTRIQQAILTDLIRVYMHDGVIIRHSFPFFQVYLLAKVPVVCIGINLDYLQNMIARKLSDILALDASTQFCESSNL
jgi:hypothetical protein